MRSRLNLKAQLNFFLKKLGWTPAELARRSGAPKQSISDWMAGTPPRNLVILKKVADTLETTLDVLLFGQAPKIEAEIPPKQDRLPPKKFEERSATPKSVSGSSTFGLLPKATEQELYLLVLRLDGGIAHANTAWQNTLGWTREETIGRPIQDFLLEKDQEVWTGILEEYRQGRNSSDDRFFRLVCKNGTCRWVLWRSALSIDTQLVYCIGSDATSRFS